MIEMNNTSSSLNNTLTTPLPNQCSSGNNTNVGHYVKVVIYLVTMAVSLCGNLLVMCIVYRNRRLRTPTNYLITNMAVSDFLMTVVSMSPTAAAFITYDFSWYDSWFGIASCKMLTFTQGATMACSIFTLTAIACERFNAIVFPLRTTIRSGNTKWVITSVWIISCLVTLPMLFVMTVVKINNVPHCRENWQQALLDPQNSPAIFTIVSFVILYALPLFLITLLYASVVYKVWLRRIPGNTNRSIKKLQRRVRKNVVKMLMTVVIVFAAFWLPLHLNMILFYVSDVFQECGVPEKLALASYILSHATGAVNFIVYVAFSEDYKQGLKSLFHCCGQKLALPLSQFQQSVLRTEQTTESRRSTSRKTDVELKRLTSSSTEHEKKSPPKGSKNVKFDLEYSSSV